MAMTWGIISSMGLEAAMLEHLRERVVHLLGHVHSVTLSTSGPAGLQASRLPCEACGLDLYILVSRTSDHLLNIETEPDVVLVDDYWNINGSAEILPVCAYPPDLCLTHLPDVAWSKIVRVRPLRLNVLATESGSPIETIDVY